MSYMEHIAHKGGVAVITGGGRGIGLAAARYFASRQMKLMLADISSHSLTTAVESIKTDFPGTEVDSMVVDVSKFEDVVGLKDKVMENYGEISILMNNAADLTGNSPVFSLTKPASEVVSTWKKSFEVNVQGVVNGCAVFGPYMAKGENSSAIINTGSKQGITNPPGNAAYNSTKGAVKLLTEHLAHELRNTPDCRCTAHLLIPGWVHTGAKSLTQKKPDGAWTPEQCVEYMVKKLDQGQFYIVCPDNESPTTMDKLRMQWSSEDISQERPALSRWHPEYKPVFEEFIRNGKRDARSRSRGRPVDLESLNVPSPLHDNL